MTAPDLVRLGFDEAEVERQFVECPKISMSTAISTGHVILVKKDQDFPDWRGRLDICGNMSWGLMKTFVWTMDFDNNKWLANTINLPVRVFDLMSRIFSKYTGFFPRTKFCTRSLMYVGKKMS